VRLARTGLAASTCDPLPDPDAVCRAVRPRLVARTGRPGGFRDRIASGGRPGSLVLDCSRSADAADGVNLTRQLRHISHRHDPRSSRRLADMPGTDLLPDLPFVPRCPPVPDRADLEVRAVLTRLRPLALRLGLDRRGLSHRLQPVAPALPLLPVPFGLCQPVPLGQTIEPRSWSGPARRLVAELVELRVTRDVQIDNLVRLPIIPVPIHVYLLRWFRAPVYHHPLTHRTSSTPRPRKGSMQLHFWSTHSWWRQ